MTRWRVPVHNGFVRLLLVEDEPHASRMLAKGLREQAYAVDVAGDGETATMRTASNDYDVVVLDLGLPDTDGVALCRTWRAEGLVAPILMLTARDAVQARIVGLDSGADDYITKPFDFDELLARLRALIRRSAGQARPEIDFPAARDRIVMPGADIAITVCRVEVFAVDQGEVPDAEECQLLDDMGSKAANANDGHA